MIRNAKSFVCWSLRVWGVVWLVFLLSSRLDDPVSIECYSVSQQFETIAEAMYRYACDHQGRLPSSYRNEYVERGRLFPHSWRVYLLPYLNEEELFRKIRLDEPWDSAWNQQFHAQMPEIYRNGEAPAIQKRGAGVTTYCIVTGVGTMFPKDGTSRNYRELDGMEHRKILLLESLPHCWMDPKHDVKIENALQEVKTWEFCENREVGGSGIVGASQNTFWVVMFNGDVYKLDSRYFPPSILWQLLLVPLE